MSGLRREVIVHFNEFRAGGLQNIQVRYTKWKDSECSPVIPCDLLYQNLDHFFSILI